MNSANIELLDYFAAHAPKVPDWFEAKAPEHPGSFRARLSPEEHSYYNVAYDELDGVWINDNLTSELSRTIQAKLDEFRRETARYYIAISEQGGQQMIRLVQWRYTYAHAMMKERARQIMTHGE